MLQERIVRICTSVLENFGPYSMDRKRCSSFQTKPRKLKYQKKIINKLHKKVNVNHYTYYTYLLSIYYTYYTYLLSIYYIIIYYYLLLLLIENNQKTVPYCSFLFFFIFIKTRNIN